MAKRKRGPVVPLLLLDGLPLSLMLAAVWIVQQDAPVARCLAALEAQGLAALPPEKRRHGGVAAVYQLLEQELDDNARAAANLLALLAAAPLPIPLLAGSISPLCPILPPGLPA